MTEFAFSDASFHLSKTLETGYDYNHTSSFKLIGNWRLTKWKASIKCFGNCRPVKLDAVFHMVWKLEFNLIGRKFPNKIEPVLQISRMTMSKYSGTCRPKQAEDSAQLKWELASVSNVRYTRREMDTGVHLSYKLTFYIPLSVVIRDGAWSVQIRWLGTGKCLVMALYFFITKQLYTSDGQLSPSGYHQDDW